MGNRPKTARPKRTAEEQGEGKKKAKAKKKADVEKLGWGIGFKELIARAGIAHTKAFSLMPWSPEAELNDGCASFVELVYEHIAPAFTSSSRVTFKTHVRPSHVPLASKEGLEEGQIWDSLDHKREMHVFAWDSLNINPIPL